MHRYNLDELNMLLERDLKQTRDTNRTWKTIEAEMEMAKIMFEAKGGYEAFKDEIDQMQQAIIEESINEEL